MALGLGFANPELKRAQMLAQLNGSTRLPAGAGTPNAPAITSTPSPSAVQPLPMPDMPMVGPGGRPSPQDVQPLPVPVPEVGPGQPQQAATPQAPEREGAPRWAQIAGAIGHVLMSADAGYHGRPLPKYDDPMKAEQDQAMAEAEFLINTTARGWEVARKAPPGQREGMLSAFEQAIKRVAPDFDFRGFIDSLETDAEKADAVAPQIATMSPEAKQMFMSALSARGGGAEAAAALLKDDVFMRGLTDFEDRRNSPVVRYKLQAVKAASKKLGMADETFRDMTAEDFAALNDQLPEQFRLSPSEISTLKRNPALGRVLGLTDPETTPDQTLDTRAGATTTVPSPRQEPGVAAPPQPAPPSTPPQGRGAAAPRSPASSGRPPRAQQQQRPPASSVGTAPIVPRGEGPVYGREGWDPQYADPAFQKSLKREADKRGATRDQVQDAMTAKARADKAPAKQAAPAPDKPAAQAAQRYKAPRDMTVPGVGKVKAGDVIIFDPATGKYRRG